MHNNLQTLHKAAQTLAILSIRKQSSAVLLVTLSIGKVLSAHWGWMEPMAVWVADS